MDVVTRRLHIRDLRADDLDAMTDMWTDPDVGRFMGTFGPRSAAQTVAWLDEVVRHNGARPRLVHDTAIIVAETGQCAGWIGCGPSDEPVAEYDFGYALRPAWRGHGYASEALTALLAFFLRDLAVLSRPWRCSIQPKALGLRRTSWYRYLLVCGLRRCSILGGPDPPQRVALGG